MKNTPVLVSLFTLFVFSARAAKTDLAGCTLTVVPLLTQIVTVTAPDGSLSSFGDYGFTTFQWDGTEQCQLLDCGGGRAPPKTDAPGCPGYTGTDTVPSLPFPTASLTLVQAAATSAATPAPAAPSSAPSVAATPTPSAVSSSPSLPVTPNSSAAPAATTTPNAQTSGAPTPTSGGSASQASDLNPTTTSNDALRVGGRWNMVLPGLVALVMASLHLI